VNVSSLSNKKELHNKGVSERKREYWPYCTQDNLTPMVLRAGRKRAPSLGKIVYNSTIIPPMYNPQEGALFAHPYCLQLAVVLLYLSGMTWGAVAAPR
jgi:hypothetical protein